MAGYDVEELYRRVIERIAPEEKLLRVEMVGLGEVTENALNLEWEKKNIKKRVFAVFVELTQNVIHHSAQRTGFKQHIGTGVIVIIEKKNAYEIISGNAVENSKVQDLVNKCQQINASSTDELKALYREQRKQPVSPGAKGSGLGLIDIARKTGNTLAATVEKIDDSMSFLVLSVHVSKEH